MSKKKLVFSGIQPTGNLHLGNYLGALKNFVSLQKEMECIYCVVDLHAITVFQNPVNLKNNVLETVASFLATGLDPKKSIIFNQSAVSGHAELAWILNCVSRIGWLNRMTQFKDKAGLDKEKASVGLFIYPNLMAADILLYKATHVPVGADQKQHLELSRDIAQKFNNDFNCKDFFPLPEPLIPKNVSRVMSLRDGTKKMSKSEESDYSRINLKDSPDEINKKIKNQNSVNIFNNNIKFDNYKFLDDVYMGIRPEHIMADDSGDIKFNIKIDLIENLGFEKIIYATLDGKEFRIKTSKNISKNHSQISFLKENIYFFDINKKRIYGN